MSTSDRKKKDMSFALLVQSTSNLCAVGALIYSNISESSYQLFTYQLRPQKTDHLS